MKRTISKRSHSWWWDSHISPKNSKWLAENLEEMDHAVKQMLKLIEGDGDSFAKKAEMYYQKRPELISRVEDFYRMYRSLAERYDNVTGELRKNIPSKLQTQGSGSGSDFSSESPFSSPSPEQKAPHPKQGHRAAGFDVFLGSVHSHKGSDGSSSSSESDSESDDATSKNLFSSIRQNGNGDVHHQRVSELENEVYILREKLQAYEEGMKYTQNGNHVELGSSIPNLKEEFSVVKEKLCASEEEVARLKVELKQKDSVQQEVESSYNGNNMVEAKLDLERQRAKELQEQIQALQIEVSDREHTIELLKVEIAVLKEDSSHEKSRIESEFHGLMESKELELELEKKQVLNLHERIDEFEAKISDREKIIADLKTAISQATVESAQEKLQLKGEISGLLESYKILESKFSCLEDEIKRCKTEKCGTDLESEKLKTENAEKGRQLEELHKNFDASKHSYDILVAEKDELSAKVQSLKAEVNSRNDQIKQMDVHLLQLHIEQMKVIKDSEDAKQAVQVLGGRVKDLEEEVERQRALIADHAEGKREAIRQLCFSIEHYRDGYEKLRQALHGHRRTIVMAS